MKRIGLFLLAVVIVVGMVGCNKGDDDADPVGTWSMNYDHACNNDIDGGGILRIYPGGTALDIYGDSGTWTIDGDNIVIVTTAVLSGEVSGDNSIVGTYVKVGETNVTGCWTATKTSDTP